MKNVKLTIEYDGTAFSGWQKQKNARTVQEEIEKALQKILKKEVKINGSGRTDAGVHGTGQIANFRDECPIPIDRIPIALNTNLPGDISIKDAVEVDFDFHARYCATGKRYTYKIYNHGVRSPILRNYSYFVPDSLNIEKMKEAAKYFVGTHDFKGFMASGSAIKDTVRTIYMLNVFHRENMIVIEVEGNGFLYNMVRIIAGTLVDVGKNRINPNDLKNIIASGIREKAGHTAPAQGLYLTEVYYETKNK